MAAVAEIEKESVEVSLPAKGSLAEKLEQDVHVRRRLLTGTEEEAARRTLTQWPDLKTVGVKSMKALALNARVLETIATWWTSYHVDHPVALKIDLMRQEAGTLHGI